MCGDQNSSVYAEPISYLLSDPAFPLTIVSTYMEGEENKRENDIRERDDQL